jgi:hypothetical protein
MEAVMEGAKGADPNIGAAYEITVFDKDGNVKQVIKEDAKCYVMNFLRMVRHWFINAYNYTYTATNFKNLSGTIVTSGGYNPGSSAIGCFLGNAAVGDLTRGIVVGTDSTPVTSDDYKIGTLINHGSGAGQFLYDAVGIGPVVESGITMTLPISRIISNGTANPITFSEIGLYGLRRITIMVLRDVISSVTIQPGESALIAYKIIING